LRDGQWWLANTDIALGAAADCPIRTADCASVLLRHGSVIVNGENQSRSAATVLRSTFNGGGYSVAIRTAGDPAAALDLTATSAVKLQPGSHVGVGIDPRALYWFPS
jgi:hypothetical protein